MDHLLLKLFSNDLHDKLSATFSVLLFRSLRLVPFVVGNSFVFGVCFVVGEVSSDLLVIEVMINTDLNNILILEDFSVFFGMLLEFFDQFHLFLSDMNDFRVVFTAWAWGSRDFPLGLATSVSTSVVRVTTTLRVGAVSLGSLVVNIFVFVRADLRGFLL